MKKRAFIIFMIPVLLMILPLKVSAQVPTPTPTASPTVAVVDNKASVSFAQLGFRDDTLASPIDSTRVLFSLPVNWQLAPGGEVAIDYDVLFSGPDVAKIVDGVNPFGGSLSVVFNQKTIGNIPLDKAGQQTARFKIPPEAINSVREDGRHQVNILLDAEFSCEYSIRASVVIKSTSILTLPFDLSAPILNLSKLPAPFYLQNALIPERTLLVLPDQPSVVELQAGLNIMAGFGSMVGTDFDFDMVQVGSLSDSDFSNSNLIFAGKVSQFPLLSKAQLPISIANGQFVNLPTASVNDGVLELAVSPWNQNKVILLISGNSDEAVSKAAYAVSSGKIMIYTDPAVSYVSKVELLTDAIPVVEDFNFKNLGYTTDTLSGIGLNSAEYVFYAAKEQIASKNGYIELVYYHSGLANYSASSMSVSLNGQVISGTAFTKENEKLTTLKIDIPVGLIRYGQNRITVSSRMLTDFSCDVTGFSNPWLVISDQSLVHLPATISETSLGRPILDLKSYPAIFLTHSDLGDLGFVLPRLSPDSLKFAGKLVYSYGKTVTPIIPNLSVAFADDVPQEFRTGKSIIAIGKASELPFLDEINDRLPAPFDLENNTASEGNMLVTYRIPAGVSVGYLELLYSPFNFEKSMLVVSGNTDAGLLMAGDALLQPDLRGQLAGLFAITNGTQIATSASVQNFSTVGNLPGAEPIVNTPALPKPTTISKVPPPVWLVPFVVLSVALIVVVLGYIVGSSLLRGRATGKIPDTPAQEKTDSDTP